MPVLPSATNCKYRYIVGITHIGDFEYKPLKRYVGNFNINSPAVAHMKFTLLGYIKIYI